MTQIDIEKISTFVHRLNKLGIIITLVSNYPWIYLDTVNGKKMKTLYYGNHGFTIYFASVRSGQSGNFTPLKPIFKEIRKVLNEGQSISNSK